MEDSELDALLRAEANFYMGAIDLIAASNVPSPSVRANGSWAAAQFRAAEGYAGRRPYAGTANFDAIERLAIRRACAVFAAEHANVQPLSGSLANLAAYKAVLRPGAKLLSMSMDSGGHLSHSHPNHVVHDLFHVVTYSVAPDTGLLDYDHVRDLALTQRPGAIVAGYSAYPRSIDFDRLGRIAAEAGSTLIADISHVAGLVAAGLHPNPCAAGALVATSVGKTLRGTRGGLILCPASMSQEVDAAVFPGLQSSIGLAGLVSLANTLFEAQSASFAQYQKSVVQNARLLAQKLMDGGIPLLTGGTDTHLLVLQASALGLSGKEAEMRLESIGILSNRTRLPSDAPHDPAGGIRLGSSAVTARGFESDDICDLADLVAQALTAPRWEGRIAEPLRRGAFELARRFRETDSLNDLLPVGDGRATNTTPPTLFGQNHLPSGSISGPR